MAAFLAAVSFVPAQAATIPYSTGFEAGEGYATGNLNGQNGWTTTGTSTIASGFFAQSGTQYAFISGTGGSATQTISNGTGLTSADVRANFDFLSSDPFTFSITGGGGLIGSATINPLNGQVTYANATTAIINGGNLINSVTGGGTANYNQFDLIANFSTNQYSFLFNGATISTLSFQNANTNISSFSFASVTNATATAIDNVSVTGSGAAATPEPSTLVMLGGGIAMLAIGAARRKKA